MRHLARPRVRSRPALRAAADPPALRPFNLPLRFSVSGSVATVFVDAGVKTAWTAALSADAAGWLSFSAASSAGTGPGLVKLTATANTTGPHSARLTVQVDGAPDPLVWEAYQAGAAPLAALNTAVLDVPFPTTPRVMELGIAGKFIGTELQKVPIIIRPLVLLIVELVVAIVGLIAILLRLLTTVAIPTLYQPKTWLPAPPPPVGFPPVDPFLKLFPVTPVVIAEETYLLDLYIAEVADE